MHYQRLTLRELYQLGVGRGVETKGVGDTISALRRTRGQSLGLSSGRQSSQGPSFCCQNVRKLYVGAQLRVIQDTIFQPFCVRVDKHQK